MSYMTLRTRNFPHQKNTFFTLFILSPTSDNTTSQNIGGDECMGCPPTSNFGGDRPPVPPRFPPLTQVHYPFLQPQLCYLNCLITLGNTIFIDLDPTLVSD